MHLVDLFVAAMVVMGIVSSALVAFHPNILYAAIALIFSLLSVSGLYASLGADFLAAAQLIIYVGGIIVVILFAVMMSENIYRAKFMDNSTKFFTPFALSLVLMFGLVRLINHTNWPRVAEVDRAGASTVENLGHALAGPYALVFQYVAIVLLAGLIGAVIVARPHHHEQDHKPGHGR